MRVGIAELHHRQGDLREFGLKSEDGGAGLGGPGRIVAKKTQHLGDMGRERVAHALGGGLVAEVERPLRQRKARLPEMQGDLGLVLLILRGEDPEEGAGTLGVKGAGRIEQRLRGLRLVEASQDGTQPRGQFGRAGFEAQGGPPEIGEAALVAIGILLDQQVGVDREQVPLQ